MSTVTLSQNPAAPPRAAGGALSLDFTGPPAPGGTGSGKANGERLALAAAQAALAEFRARYEQVAVRYDALLTAARAGVVEARTGRRDPLIPIAEALADLGELPSPGIRLSEVLPECAAAWPAGAQR